MADVQVAESALSLDMAYNTQEENRSKYQKRVINYLYPTQSGDLISGSTNMVLRFLVPSSYFLDTKKSYLSFEAYVSSAINDLDTVYFTGNTDTWITRIQITTNQGVLIENIINADVIAAMMTKDMDETSGDSVCKGTRAFWDYGYVNSGNTDPALVVSGAAATVLTTPFSNTSDALTPKQKQYLSCQKRRYAAYLDFSGFLQSFNLLPLMAMANGNSNAFQIEIEFNIPTKCLVAYTTGANPAVPNYGTAPTTTVYNYTISNCYYVQSLVQDDVKEQEIMQIIKSTPLILSYHTHKHYTNVLSGAQQTLNITEFQESVQELQLCFRPTANINVYQQDQTIFSNPNLKQVQLQIGSTYVPSQVVICGGVNTAYGTSPVPNASGTVYVPKMSELITAFCNTNCKMRKYFKGNKPENFLTKPYTYVDGSSVTHTSQYVLSSKEYQDLIIAFDLRVFADDAVGDELYNQYYSGLNLKSNPNALQFIFTLDTSTINVYTQALITPANYQFDGFTTYRSNLVVQAGESYVIS